MSESSPAQSRCVMVLLSIWMTVVTIALVGGIVCFWSKGMVIGGAAAAGAAAAPEPKIILMLILLLGAAGAQIHALQSFADFVGNGSFASRWAFWYMKRPLIGALVALVAYAGLSGGLVGADSAFARAPANLWSLAVVCLGAGMFSRLVTDKLYEVVSTLFAVKTENKQTRSDALDGPASRVAAVPKLAKLEPDTISLAQSGAIKITGEHFTQTCKLKLDGREAAFAFKSATEIELPATSLQADPGKFKVTIRGENAAEDAPGSLDLTVT